MPLVVLIADDNEDNRQVYCEYFTNQGVEVVEAGDGNEVLSLVQSQRFDAIVLDLRMPVLDGWETTLRLRANPRTRQLPIVALTAHAVAGAREEARAVGVDDFLVKPCLPEVVFKLVESLALSRR